MRTKFTFNTQGLFTAVALLAMLVGAKVSKAQAPFEAGRTYYVNGVGKDFVAPKDTFMSLAGRGNYTAGVYTDSTGIFPALSVNGIDSNTLGQITILLVPGYTGLEVGFPILKGVPYASPNRPIVMKPFNGDYTITRSTFSAGDAVIRLEGTQFFTIDGEGTPGQRNLKFMIPSTASTFTHKAVIELVTPNPAVSAINTVTIKNVNVYGVLGSTSPNFTNAVTNAGIFGGGTTAFGSSGSRRAENISIINCNIQNVQYGVHIRGLAAGALSQDLGLVIKNNIIGGEASTFLGSNTPQNQAAIAISNQANALIEGNTISGAVSPSAVHYTGIYVTSAISTNLTSLDSNITINANKIYNLKCVTNGAVIGIRFQHPTLRSQPMGYRITNNVISGISSFGTSNALLAASAFPVGISIEENTSNASVEIYNNSIAMWDETLKGGTSGTSAACIYIGQSTTGGVKLANNIFSNRMKNFPNDEGAYQVSGVVVNNNAMPFELIDNNIYDISTSGGWAFVGRTLSRFYASIDEWRTYSKGDANSLKIKPVFNDPLTLVTNNGAATTYGTLGRVLVPFDITGAARPSLNHSIGAYQFTQDASLAPASLMGGSTYMINGVSNPPTASNSAGSFKNLSDFVSHLNSYGVGGPTDSIKIMFDNGYNTSGGDSMAVIPAIVPYPNRDGLIRQFVLSTTPGVSVTVKLGSNLTIPSNSAVFRLLGVSDFHINGKGPNNERTITFALSDTAKATMAKVLSITPTYLSPTSRVTVTFCNLHGNAFSTGIPITSTTVYTAAGIYIGDPLSSSGLGNALAGTNRNLMISNNFIGGVKNGIYWSAKDSLTDQLNNILNNVIGGSMTVPGTGIGRVYLIGGAINNSGIYIKGLQTSIIDSNIVRNSHSNFTGFSGIYLNGSSTIGRSRDLVVTRNTVYNLGCINPAGGFAVGIRVALNEANRSIRIQNNFITKIYGAGGSPTSFGSVSAPSGIAIDPISSSIPGGVISLGLNISHNTVNLPQYPGLQIATGYYSAAFFVGDRVGGLRVVNNIFANTAGRSSYSNAITAALAFGGTRITNTDAFTANEGNVYYANGSFSSNYVGIARNSNNTLTSLLYTITELRSYITIPNSSSDNLSSFGEVPFLNDTTILMNPYFIGHIVKNPDIFTEPTVDRDITGAPRPAGTDNTSVGALHIDPLTAYEHLMGGQTYLVNGILAPPTASQQTGSFNTINNLFRYINTNGVDDDQFPIKTITINITSGYAGEGDTAITPLMKYPQMSPFRYILIKPETGATPVIASTGATAASAFEGASSVIKIQGARNIIIDGSNSNTNSRDLTVRLPLQVGSPGNLTNISNPFARVIDVIGWEYPAEEIVIKNCNIIGNSTPTAINTFAGIYQGGVAFGVASNNVPLSAIRTGNNRNQYTNNKITAVKYGVYLRGANIVGGADMDNIVSRNIIGGNIAPNTGVPTDYFGNGTVVTSSLAGPMVYAAGISAFSQTQLTIDSNVIQNSMRTTPAVTNLGIAGIELSTVFNVTAGASSKVKLSRNIINNIRTDNNAPAYGVYVNLPWTERRSINIENNMISRINASNGGATYGVYLDATTAIPVADIDVNIYHNSINLSNLDSAAAGVTACIGSVANARGTIKIENNILVNKIARKAGSAANYIFAAQYQSGNAYSVVDNNSYYVNGFNAVNNIGLMGNTTLSSFASWVNYTKQDTMSMNYPAPFTSESDLFIPAGTASPLYRGGRRISTVAVDILGTARPAGDAATIGAHEFNGTYADSVAPKIYDYTPLPDYCGAPMQIRARVLDRNASVSDTLYYTVNGALPELFLLPSISVGADRLYDIPFQPDNTFIAYRISAVDGAGKTGSLINADKTTGRNYTTTQIGTFPIAIGFDEPNIYGLRTQQISGTQGWNLESFGSQSNPFLFPKTGAKAALLPAGDGASRIITPCLDFTNMKLPVVRLYVSQNADFPNLNDSIIIKKWFAFSQYTEIIPVNPIKRVNPNPLAVPGYKVYDICVKEMNGNQNFKLSIEGYSKGGSNLIIDSIIILDNFVDHDVTNTTVNSCFNDSFAIQVSNTSSQNEYYLYDDLTGRVVSPRVLGNGGALNLKGYLSSVDSAHIKAMYTNITALGCEVDPFLLTKYTKVYFGTFKNGPYVKKGASFYGVFNDGTVANPDAVRIGGTAEFEVSPPGTSTNADYGTTWTISNVELRNYANNQLNTTALSLVAATPSTPALIQFTGLPADSNKLFRLSITLRLLPQGCDSVVVRYVRVANAPVAYFYTSNDTLCQDQSTLFFNGTSNGVFTLPVTYTWDFGDGETSLGVTPYKKFTTPGVYKVKLIARNTSTLVDSISFDYVVNPSPTASYTNTTPCYNKAVKFTNTGSSGSDITYSWNIAGQLFTDTNPTTSIPYSDTIVAVRLIVRNGQGCIDTAYTPTAVFAQPTAAFTANNVCAGASVQFNNASTIDPGKENRKNEIGYEWDFGNNEIGYAEDPLYKYPAGGNYNVTLTVKSNYGCIDTATAPVSIFSKPIANFDINNTCKSTAIAVANNSTYTGGLDKINYKWNFGDNSPLQYVAVPTKQYGEARAFFVTLIVTDTVNFCSDSLTKLISVKESAKAEFTASNGCVNSPVKFTNVSIIPAGVNPVYTWDFGGPTSNDQSPTHTFTAGGDKVVSLVLDIDGCKSTAFDTISISNAPVIRIDTLTSLDGSRYEFEANDSNFDRYAWNFGDGSSVTRGKGLNTAENTFAREGSYKVKLIATDKNGCSATDSMTVVITRTVGLKDDAIAAKFSFNLYPNPFTVGAKAVFELDTRKEVTVEIFDMLGRKVFTKNEGELPAGKHEVGFNENDFSAKAGVYLVKVQIGNEVITSQLIKQ